MILTGLLDDGTSELMVVRALEGEAIIQGPEDALFPAMPRNALKQVPSAHVLPQSEIPDLLVRLVGEDLSVQGSYKRQRADDAVKETRISEFNMSEIANENRLGRPSVFGSPDCGGVLWEIEDNDFLHFRCRVGHAYTANHLDAEQRH